jgi:hypothetical protein
MATKAVAIMVELTGFKVDPSASGKTKRTPKSPPGLRTVADDDGCATPSRSSTLTNRSVVR